MVWVLPFRDRQVPSIIHVSQVLGAHRVNWTVRKCLHLFATVLQPYPVDTSVFFSECLCGPCAWHEYDRIRYLEDAEGDLPSQQVYIFEFNQGRICVEFVYDRPSDIMR